MAWHLAVLALASRRVADRLARSDHARLLVGATLGAGAVWHAVRSIQARR